MADRKNLYAVLAEFDDSARLIEATRSVRESGFTRIDAFTPFPVPGLAEALNFSDRAVPLATLAGGIMGAALGFALQVFTVLDFPLWIGGRPLIAVPAFMLVTFETLVLGAVLSCIGTMLVRNRLPRLNHPMFDADDFGFASRDRFFLAIFPDEAFDRNAVGKALAALHPKAIIDVPGKPKL
ncbi:DUF3341 domain-containing protein [Novosphingobium sp. M1R2S20]|uniref:DUF3341 domain-containing protein n=1 Tax=Novosphingobium rhizovicinum TaxID=3228928 RepID=A0ABV3RGW0_9SPHN